MAIEFFSFQYGKTIAFWPMYVRSKTIEVFHVCIHMKINCTFKKLNNNNFQQDTRAAIQGLSAAPRKTNRIEICQVVTVEYNSFSTCF